MRLLTILIATIILTGCFPSRTRNVFGNGEEFVTKHVVAVDYSNRYKNLGYFTLEQYRRFWFGDLTTADMTLSFTNDTPQTLSYTFYIHFELKPWNTRHRTSSYNRTQRYSGNFRYTGSVINVHPGETVNFGIISERIVNLNDGSIVIRPDINTLKRN